MRCDICREAISARLDGEEHPGESSEIDAHLETCAGCRRFADQAAHVTRLARTRIADPGPDLVAGVLAAAPTARWRRRTAVLRVALGVIGLGQLAVAVAGIVAVGTATGHGTIVVGGASAAHFAHESAAWNLALAVGFLYVALRPPRVTGLVPVIGSFVGMLAALSALDVVVGGRVDPARLVSHLLVLAGLILLLALQHRTGGGGSRTPAATAPAGPAGTSGPQPSPAPRGVHGDDDGDGLRPTARHRAA